MKVLLLGAGGVGEAYASHIHKWKGKTDWCELLVIADYNVEKAKAVAERLNDPRIVPEFIDATKKEDIVAMGKKYGVEMIVTCLDLEPFNVITMNACLELGVHYLDCGFHNCERDPNNPLIITKMPGEDQLALSDQFEEKQLYACCACGVEPGMIDYFARYAEQYLFDELEEMGVRDGSNFESPESDMPFAFSIYQTITEASRGPIYWEKDKGFYSKPPMSDPEDFWLPKGIGMTRMVACKHSEPMNMARHIGKGLQRTNFKIAFGLTFEDSLKTLQTLGLATSNKLNVKGVEVSPIDVIAAAAPEMADVGLSMVGKTCSGLWVKGKKDGMERQVYLYQVADNEECVELLGCPAVPAETACTPVIVTGLIAEGKIVGPYGARVSEEFACEPVLTQIADYGFPAGLLEMESEYREYLEAQNFLAPMMK